MPNARRFGVVCAAATVTAGLVLAGCGDRIEGTAEVNQSELASYRTEAASSSAAATSSRRAAAQAQAVTDNCAQFPTISGTGVAAYNAFVDAHDSNASDYAAKREAAATTLDDAAAQVQAGVDSAQGALPPELSALFVEYVDAARQLAVEARKMSYTAQVDALNAASKRVNDARNAVRDACPKR